MIRTITIYRAFALFIGLTAFHLAHAEGDNTYVKEFDRTYSVASDVTMELNTSFGEATISTWDQNTIEIHVEVKVDSKSEDKANKIFDKIDVKIIESTNRIKLKTDVDVDSNGDDWSIDIVVKMPKSGNLDADHAFGSLSVGDITGKCNIDLSYGELNADRLPHRDNDIKVAFGDGEVDQLGGGEIKVEFGNLEIEEVNGNAEISCNYGDLEIDKISKSCTRLDVHNDFGSVELTLESGSHYEVSANSSFGDVDLPSSARITSEKEDFTSKQIEATIGSGGTPGIIEINSSFGDAEIDID